MKKRFLESPNEMPSEKNIYGDKSALVLNWLLTVGLDLKTFSIREVAKETMVSLGLVQRVFHTLVLKGLLHTKGIRTAKTFYLRNPSQILKSWLQNYNCLKKCKMRTYRSALQEKEEWILALKKQNLNTKVALALHSAAEAYNCKNTNLNTLELYLLDSAVKQKLEAALHLEPQEKGYEVLLIEPYYKSMLTTDRSLIMTSPLLTFLDLYHFPIRGREQAEFMAQKLSELRRIYELRERR